MGLANSDPLAHSTYVGAKQVDWKADGVHLECFAYLTKSGLMVFGFWSCWIQHFPALVRPHGSERVFTVAFCSGMSVFE